MAAWTDGQTDGWTDGGINNIPITFLTKCVDNISKCCRLKILPLVLSVKQHSKHIQFIFNGFQLVSVLSVY